jgi:hypothetical protein
MRVGKTSVNCYRYSVMAPIVVAKVLLRKGGDRDNITPILLLSLFCFFSLLVASFYFSRGVVAVVGWS